MSLHMDIMFGILFTTRWYFHGIYNHTVAISKHLARIATMTLKDKRILLKVSISLKKKDLQSFLLVYPRCFWHVYLKLIRHLKNNKCFQNSLSVNIVYLAGIFTIIQKQEVSMNSVDLRWTWMQLTYNDQNKFKLEWRREKKITVRTMFFNWKSKRTFLSERTDNYDINCLIGFCQRERLWVCV